MMHILFIRSTFIVILCFMGFSGCKEYETTPRDYPRLHTLPVDDATTSGAHLSAEIIYIRDGVEIIEHGFVWSKSNLPRVLYNDQKIIDGTLVNRRFETRIETTFEKNVTYFFRSYVKTNQYLVYGREVSFRIED